MQFIRPLTRRAYTMLGTMLAIAGLIIGYFSFYLPNRQEKIIEQKSRVLTQIARNFETKWGVFQKNATKMGDTESIPLKITLIPKAIKKDTIVNTTSARELESALEIIETRLITAIQAKQNLDSIFFSIQSPQELIQKLEAEKFNLDDPVELIFFRETLFKEKDIIFDLSSKKNLDISLHLVATNLYNSLKRFDYISFTYKDNYSKELATNDRVQVTPNLKEEVTESLKKYIFSYRENHFLKDFLSRGNNSLLNISFDEPRKNPFNFFHYQKQESEPGKESLQDLSIKEFYINIQPGVFMEPLLETEDFDGYFLYYTKEDSSKSAHPEKVPEVVFQSLQGELFAEQIYQAKKSGKEEKTERIASHTLYSPTLNQGTILNAQLNGTAYKLLETTFMTSGKDASESNIKWHLVGLVEKKHFEKEVRSVPPILIVTYSLALLLILFGLPQLKLLFMSRIEQLSTTNFVLSCLSAVLCTSLLIIILLGLNAYVIHENKRADRGLKAIADSLDHALEAETNAMYQAVRKYDGTDTLPLPATADNVNSFSLISYHQSDPLSKSKTSYELSDFDILFWINDQGRIIKEYSTIQTEDHHNALILKEREYFQRIIKQTAWKNTDKEVQKEFFIESIQSWDKGDKSCVLAIKSNQRGAAVVGIQKQLSSLFHTVLPVGYEFQVIDQTGLVLFHSNEDRNLQENFLSENNGNSGITASMVSNTALFTDNEYKHHNYRSYIKPLTGVPWYLVVSYDRRYSSIPVSLVVAYTLISSVLIAITLSILFIITTRLNRPPSRLAKSKLNINWLRPKEASGDLYSKAVQINIAIILLLIGYNLFNVISYQSFTIFLITTILLYTTLYFKFRKKDKIDISVYLCLALAAIIFLVQWVLYELTIYDLLYLTILLAILYVYIFKDEVMEVKPANNKKESTIKKILNSPGFRVSYTNMLFTFLIICAVLPAIFLFSKLYQEEQLIWRKHALFELNKKVLERDNVIQQKYQFFSDRQETSNRTSALIKAWEGKGAYYKAAGYNVGSCLETDLHAKSQIKKPLSWSYKSLMQEGRSDHYLLSIFQKARPNIAGLVTETNGFLLDQGYNTKWSQVYHEMITDSSQLSGKENMMHLHIDNQPLRYHATSVESPMPALFKNNFGIYNFLLAIILLALLFLLYLAIHYILRAYFSWHLFTLSETFKLNNDKPIPAKRNSKNKKVFFVTSPYTSKVPLQAYDPVNLTLINDPDEFAKIQKMLEPSDKKTKILLQNFSYNPQSIETWNKKLALLEELLSADQDRDREIAIQSHFRPLQIFEVYEKRIQKIEHEIKQSGNKDEPELPATVEDLNEALSRWKDALSSFYKVFVTPQKEIQAKSDPIASVVALNVDCLLKREMAAWPDYFSWMPYYKDRIINEISINLQRKSQPVDSKNPEIINEIKEEVILKVQSMAQPFYFSLWNNCSMEEKYVLYDLAKDGFINPKARNQVYLLMEKGMVYQDENDQLHIKNKSFRNFILTNIKKSEALEIENQVTQMGTYSIMKAALMVIAIASLGFIAFTNQAHLENLIALFAGLAAIIPMLFRFGSWFGPAESLKT